jgi:surfactin synthase thioesterase subunit
MIGSARPPTDSSAWAFAAEPRPGATMTLICFHAAGSGPAMYRNWAQRLPGSVATVLIRMPGRESRLAEEPLVDFDAAVAALQAGLAGWLRGDYALYGHSMGAYLACAVAAAGIAAGWPAPRHIFVSAARPPHLFRPPLGPGRSADADLIGLLDKMGGTDPALLENDEMRQIILRSFRADLSVCASIRAPAGRLPCPVSAFGGERDDIAREDLQEWSRWTSGPVRARMFGGGHFFVNAESEDDVLGEVAGVLSGYRPCGAARPGAGTTAGR